MDLAAHLHRVVEVEIVSEHRLRVALHDGVSGELDASDWDRSRVFEPLSDPAYFAGAELDPELGSIRGRTAPMSHPETLHLWVVRGCGDVL